MTRNQSNPQTAPVIRPRDRFSVGDKIKVVYQRSRHFGRTGTINRLGDKKHIFIDWDDDGDGEFCDFKHAIMIESSGQRRERLMALERERHQTEIRAHPSANNNIDAIFQTHHNGRLGSVWTSNNDGPSNASNHSGSDTIVTTEQPESQTVLNHMAFVSASIISAHWEDDDMITSLTRDFEQNLRLQIQRQTTQRRNDV